MRVSNVISAKLIKNVRFFRDEKIRKMCLDVVKNIAFLEKQVFLKLVH